MANFGTCQGCLSHSVGLRDYYFQNPPKPWKGYLQMCDNCAIIGRLRGQILIDKIRHDEVAQKEIDEIKRKIHTVEEELVGWRCGGCE